MDRRDFLKTVGSAAMAAGALVAQHPASAVAAHTGPGEKEFRLGISAYMSRFMHNPEHIQARIAKLANAGISLILVGVDRPWYGHGLQCFTDVAPVNPTYPDWDPFKVFVEAAHENGMAVYPMLSCFKPDVAVRADLFEKHPGSEAIFSPVWEDGVKNQGKYSCAMQPRVQKYVFDMYRSIAERYGPEGLELDFVRTGSQCTCDYCTAQMAKIGIDIRAIQAKYDADRQLWLQRSTKWILQNHKVAQPIPTPWDSGTTPEELESIDLDEELGRWLDWRVDQLAHFVSQVTQYAHKHNMVNSAAVKHFWPVQTPTGAQDWVRWAKDDLLDDLGMMIFDSDASYVMRTIREATELLTGTRPEFWPCLATHPESWNPEPSMLANQVKIVKRMGLPGVVIHSEKFLTDEHLALLKGI